MYLVNKIFSLVKDEWRDAEVERNTLSIISPRYDDVDDVHEEIVQIQRVVYMWITQPQSVSAKILFVTTNRDGYI